MLEIPRSYCGKSPGDYVCLFFRTGQEHLGTRIYERFYRVIKFYPFIVLCTDENGFRRCFSYWEFRTRLNKLDTMRMM